MREIPDYAALKRIETNDLKREYTQIRRQQMEDWRSDLDKAGLKKPSRAKLNTRQPSFIPLPDNQAENGNNPVHIQLAGTVHQPTPSAQPLTEASAKKIPPDSPTIINMPDVVIKDYDESNTSATINADSSTLASPSSRRFRQLGDNTPNNRDPSPAKSSTAVASQKSASPVKTDKWKKDNNEAWLPSWNESQISGSRRASFESNISWQPDAKPKKPSMDRRLSSAMDTIKDSLKNTFYPENWNWMRYDRDEEVLSAFNKFNRYKNKLMSRMNHSPSEEQEHEDERMERIRRQFTDKQKWQRGYHPAINDLHPPIASQLPATREDAGWMLLPPPSADVMAGRSRPGADDHLRVPMCVIGKPVEDKSTAGRDHLYPVSSDKGSSDHARMSSSASSTPSVDENWSLPGWVSVTIPPRAYREVSV